MSGKIWVAPRRGGYSAPGDPAVRGSQGALPPDRAMCACGHTLSSHAADGDCVGCTGPDCA